MTPQSAQEILVTFTHYTHTLTHSYTRCGDYHLEVAIHTHTHIHTPRICLWVQFELSILPKDTDMLDLPPSAKPQKFLFLSCMSQVRLLPAPINSKLEEMFSILLRFISHIRRGKNIFKSGGTCKRVHEKWFVRNKFKASQSDFFATSVFRLHGTALDMCDLPGSETLCSSV